MAHIPHWHFYLDQLLKKLLKHNNRASLRAKWNKNWGTQLSTNPRGRTTESRRADTCLPLESLLLKKTQNMSRSSVGCPRCPLPYTAHSAAAVAKLWFLLAMVPVSRQLCRPRYVWCIYHLHIYSPDYTAGNMCLGTEKFTMWIHF